MSQVFNACRMHSLPLTTECGACASERDKKSEREGEVVRVGKGSDETPCIHMSAIMQLYVCMCVCVHLFATPTQFWLFF